jgi:predicted CopG family antitoxin
MRYFPTKSICRKSKAIELAETAKGLKKSDEVKEVKSKKEKANPMTINVFSNRFPKF